MPKDTDFMALNRYRNVNRKEIDEAKRFLSGQLDKSKVASWVKRFDKHLEVKGNELLLDGKIVVGNDERDDLMRELVYAKDSDVAPSRDAGYYTVKKRYANISRRNWMNFLKKQRVIRQTDNAPPKQKHGGRKLNKKGELEADLFFIGVKDLAEDQHRKLRIGDKQQYYVLNVVDRLTSYCKLYYCTNKTKKVVGKKLKQSLDFFADLLNINKSDITVFTDNGGEFSDKGWGDVVGNVKHVVIEVGPKVEQKNSHVQRVFHRLKNAERITSISDGLRQAEVIVNKSYNRVMKMSAEEAVKKYNDPDETKKLLLKYNAQRQKADTDRRADLQVGDWVRIVVKSSKDSPFYKAYRGVTYTREGFPINPDNKHAHKGKSVTKKAYEVKDSKGKNPKKYLVDGKWYPRDRLSEPLPVKKDKDGKKTLDYPDEKSEALIRGRIKKPVRAKPAPKPEKPKPDKKATPAVKKMAKKVEKVVDKLEDEDDADEKVAELKKAPHFTQIQAEDKMNLFRIAARKNYKDMGMHQAHNDLKLLGRYLIEYYTWHRNNGLKMFRYDNKRKVEELKKMIKELK